MRQEYQKQQQQKVNPHPHRKILMAPAHTHKQTHNNVRGTSQYNKMGKQKFNTLRRTCANGAIASSTTNNFYPFCEARRQQRKAIFYLLENSFAVPLTAVF